MSRLKRIICAFLSICLVSMPVALSVTSIGAEESIDSLEQQLQELEEQNEEYQAILDKTQAVIEEKEAYSEALVSKIEVLDDKIILTRESIESLNADIEQKQADIDQANLDIEDQIDALCSRLRTIYMAGSASDLEIILGAKDFSDLVDKMSLVKILSNYDRDLINDINLQLEEITKQKEELEADKAELEQKQAALEADQAEFNELLEENDEILRNLYATSEDAENAIEHAALQSDEIESQIAEYYQKLQEQLEQERQEAEKEDDGYTPPSYGNGYSPTPSPSGYVWPVPGFYHRSSEWNENRGEYNHGAIDIAGSGIMGATVLASDSGYVISSYNGCPHNWGKYGSCGCGGGYGNYVMIDHGNGKMTVYAHFTNATVSAGQSVSKGQVIGYVGSTGESTGPHLHYETRLNGVKYNPMLEF